MFEPLYLLAGSGIFLYMWKEFPTKHKVSRFIFFVLAIMLMLQSFAIADSNAPWTFDSSIIPALNDTFNMGNNTHWWMILWIQQIWAENITVDNLDVANINITNFTISGNIDMDGYNITNIDFLNATTINATELHVVNVTVSNRTHTAYLNVSGNADVSGNMGVTGTVTGTTLTDGTLSITGGDIFSPNPIDIKPESVTTNFLTIEDTGGLPTIKLNSNVGRMYFTSNHASTVRTYWFEGNTARGGVGWSKLDNALEMFSTHSIKLQPNGDSTDYVSITTNGDIPRINSEGDSDLQITASSGLIDFEDDNLTTTGNITADTANFDELKVDEQVEFSGSNIIFLDCSANIETVANSVSSGTTLQLGSCNYVITDDIDLTTVPVKIKGQGKNKTKITLSGSTKYAFDVRVAGVSISDLTINCTGSHNQGIRVQMTAGEVSNDFYFENLKIINHGSGASYAFFFADAGGIIRNVESNISSVDNFVVSVYAETRGSAEKSADLFIFDSNFVATVSGGTNMNAEGLVVRDNAASQDMNVYAYNSYFSAETTVGTGYGLHSWGGSNAKAYSKFTYYDGEGSTASYDAFQADGALLELLSSTLEDAETGGTITKEGTLYTKSILADNITDGTMTITGGAITGATNTDWDAAYTHVSSSGTDHSYIDQDVTTTATPTFGGIKVGSDGTTFGEIQYGTATLGTSAGNVKTYVVTFPNAFSSTPSIMLTPNYGSYTDGFAVMARNIGTGSFTIVARRTDSTSGWGLSLKVTWMAWN